VGQHYRDTYDLLSRPLTMESESLYDPGVWTTLANGAQYNAAGQLTHWVEGSVYTLARTYSAERGWLTQLTALQYSTPKLNLSYSYYPNGRVQAVTDTVNPAQSASYGYDHLNRLTSASTSGWGLAWTYDDFGNRLTQSATLGTPPTSTVAYDETTNQITTSGYSFDANGNMTAMPGETMTYDVAKAMNARFEDGESSSFLYADLWRNAPQAHAVQLSTFGGLTISQFLARPANAGTNALAELSGNLVFVRPGVIGTNLTHVAAFIFHEVLHHLGLGDEEIKARLGIPAWRPSADITGRLRADCFTW
jgi:YD repeat-containing protein